jgi:hypothetical protein
VGADDVLLGGVGVHAQLLGVAGARDADLLGRLGGEGAVWRGVLGVLTLAIIGNGFDLFGVESTYQMLVQGADPRRGGGRPVAAPALIGPSRSSGHAVDVDVHGVRVADRRRDGEHVVQPAVA